MKLKKLATRKLPLQAVAKNRSRKRLLFLNAPDVVKLRLLKTNISKKWFPAWPMGSHYGEPSRPRLHRPSFEWSSCDVHPCVRTSLGRKSCYSIWHEATRLVERNRDLTSASGTNASQSQHLLQHVETDHFGNYCTRFSRSWKYNYGTLSNTAAY